VSLKSGSAVAAALESVGYGALTVPIDRDGSWRLGASIARDPAQLEGPGAPPAEALSKLGGETGRRDVVFVALHGSYGEDGTIQGLLEAAGFPYTGSGVAASALAMDKERTKEVLVHHGLRTAPWVAVDRARWDGAADGVVGEAAERLGFPVIVKPPREGSSFGLALAHDEAELRAAVAACVDSPDGRALLERRIDGTEVSCPVLGNRADALRALPIVEIVPKGRELFDYDAKYLGASDEICPARIPADVAERVRAQALTAHRVLGCDGVSRSDFIVAADGEPWFLETNTIPGMTPESLCPLSARAAGISFEGLCERLVELALERADEA